MLYKASAVILPKSKSFVFWIFKPPNFAKFRDIFSDNHFGNICFSNIGFPLWFSIKESK